FKRPVLERRTLRPLLANEIGRFLARPVSRTPAIPVANQFSVRFVEAPGPHSQRLVLGMIADENSGGYTIQEIVNNLAVCAKEKSTKIAPYRARYAAWWLVLPDHIGRGLDAHDVAQLRAAYQRPIEWDKVILINPFDFADAVEL